MERLIKKGRVFHDNDYNVNMEKLSALFHNLNDRIRRGAERNFFIVWSDDKVPVLNTSEILKAKTMAAEDGWTLDVEEVFHGRSVMKYTLTAI